MLPKTAIIFLVATLLILLFGILGLVYQSKKKEIHKNIRKEINKEKRRQKKEASK